MPMVFQDGGPEKSFCKAVKIQPVFHLRFQDVGNGRVVGYLPKKAVDPGVEAAKEEEVC